MKTLRILLTLLCLLPALTAQQVLVNECYTASTDAFEVANVGLSPQTMTGWRVEYGGINTVFVWTPGTFFFPSGTVIAPGEAVAVRESTVGPSVAAGAQVFLTSGNINWATTPTTRGGACILVDANGVGSDMVRWANAVPPSNFGANFTGTVNPSTTNFGRINITDTDSAADWGDMALNYGTLNPGQNVPIAALTVTVSTTGVGDVSWSVVSQNPAVSGGEIYNFVSTQDFDPDGSGPFFGIGFDAIPQIALPAGPNEVFHTFLDASGQWSLNISSGLPPGLHVETTSILLGSGGVERISNTASITF